MRCLAQSASTSASAHALQPAVSSGLLCARDTGLEAAYQAPHAPAPPGHALLPLHTQQDRRILMPFADLAGAPPLRAQATRFAGAACARCCSMALPAPSAVQPCPPVRTLSACLPACAMLPASWPQPTRMRLKCRRNHQRHDQPVVLFFWMRIDGCHAGTELKVNTALWNTIQLLFAKHVEGAPPTTPADVLAAEAATAAGGGARGQRVRRRQGSGLALISSAAATRPFRPPRWFTRRFKTPVAPRHGGAAPRLCLQACSLTAGCTRRCALLHILPQASRAACAAPAAAAGG